MTAATRPLAALGSACMAGLLLFAWAPPAGAAPSGGLTVTLGQRWKVAGSIGAWTPYTVTVRYDGPGTFNGDVFLVPNLSRSGPLPSDYFPQYRSPLTVPSGSERTAQIYVIEAPGGYHAELRDTHGRVVVTAASNFAAPNGAAVAILSDLPQAEQRISAPLKSLSRIEVGISQFASTQAFPSGVVYLSALNGLIIDQFDSGALDHAQMQALKDFVGLGGTLILVGGSSWRRTLTPMDHDLLPLRPIATATASLAALGEMAGLVSTAAVQVVTGDVASWAKVALASPEGRPLIVEGAYGGGRVVALTFDPLAEPVAGHLDLAALSWSQAISRGLSGSQGGSQLAGFGFGGPVQPSTLRMSGPGTWSPFPGYVTQILNDTPAASSPALGLLAALLIGYGLLASLLSYIVLRAIGRRGMLWVIVPALAVAFTAGSYLVGFGTRSLDYRLTGVQVQRLGPEGVVETYGLGAVLSPRRGDVRVSAAPNTLVSTAIPVFGPLNPGAESVITVGPRPELLFTNVAVWELRPVQTLTMNHVSAAEPGADTAITAELRMEQGRVKGQVTNHTSRTVREMQLVSASGTGAQLVATLAPGETAKIDQAVTQATPGMPSAKNAVIVQGGGVVGPGPVYTQNSRQALIALAASQAVGRGGDLALVGLTDPVDTLQVGGGRAASSTRAVVVEPVRLQSADSLAGIAPQARLVSDHSDGAGTSVDVYEVDLPRGVNGRIGLSLAFLKSAVTPTPYPVEVYDWDLHAWRSISPQANTAPLTQGETAGGVVRVRVKEDRPGQAVLTATSIP